MGTIDTHFAFARFFLFVIGLVLIVFLSSPTVMLTRLQKLDPTSFLSFGWTQDFGRLGTYLHKSLPPLLILLINVTIIWLLDYASVIEAYDSHSQYQTTVYVKTVVYTTLNLFIIPVLTISNNGGTLYDLFMANNFNIAKLLSELFIPKSGEFFILLLVQQGVLSAVWYALNLPDIIWSYFTPALAFERRKIFNDQAPWRRDEQTTFLYGYFNSQIMTIFTICIFYAPTVPLVPAAAAFFVYLRHTVDGYNLLTYYRREIDSSGKMIDFTTNTALIVCISY